MSKTEDWLYSPSFYYRKEVFEWAEATYERSNWQWIMNDLNEDGASMEIGFKKSEDLTFFMIKWASILQ